MTTLQATRERTVLHVGCGEKRRDKLHATFHGEDWREVRFDIDAGVMPDIVGDMTDMRDVASESMDALWSSHNVEHLQAHQVPVAFSEFFRVIKPSGFCLITCPDIQAIAKLIAEDKLEQPAYVSASGPITPLDMVFGFGRQIALGHIFMSHRTGFTPTTLGRHLLRAGFGPIKIKRGALFDLWAEARKPA